MVVMGGVVQRGGQESVTDEIWTFDLELLTWTARQPLPYPVAFAGAVTTASGPIVLVGGTDGLTARNDILQLSVDRFINVLAPSSFAFQPVRLPRLQSPSVIALPDVNGQPPADRIFIFGGEDSITDAFCAERP